MSEVGIHCREWQNLRDEWERLLRRQGLALLTVALPAVVVL
jgi:hypothetical protein